MPVHAWEVHDDVVWVAADPALLGRAPPNVTWGKVLTERRSHEGLGAMAMWQHSSHLKAEQSLSFNHGLPGGNACKQHQICFL